MTTPIKDLPIIANEFFALYRDVKYYRMTGSKYGEHKLLISETSPNRLEAHWQNYCQPCNVPTK